MQIAHSPFLKVTMQGNNKAYMELYGAIMTDDEPEVDAAGMAIPGIKLNKFKAAFAELKAAHITDIDMDVNTPGGDIFSGLAMYDEMKGCGMNINVCITGICASMGTVLMLGGDGLPTCKPNGMLMFHKPKGAEFGEAAKLRESADMLDKLEARVVAIYCEAFGMDEADVKKWMKPNVNKWFTAKEAEQAGIIRGIVTNPAGQSATPTTKPNARMSALDVFKMHYTPQNTNQPNMTLPKLTLDKLKLTASATDADVAAAVDAIVTERDNAVSELDKVQKAAKLEMRNRAEMRIDQAVKDKILLAAERDEYVSMAIDNYTSVDKMLNKMKPAGNITMQLKPADGDSNATFQMSEEEKKYSFRDWEKKNAKKLLQMKTQAFDIYNQMHIDEYGVPAKVTAK